MPDIFDTINPPPAASATRGDVFDQLNPQGSGVQTLNTTPTGDGVMRAPTRLEQLKGNPFVRKLMGAGDTLGSIAYGDPNNVDPRKQVGFMNFSPANVLPDSM